MEWIGIQTGALSPLRKVFEEWLALNQYCVDNWGGEVPWRYNEQSTVSYFAGAIWRSGGFAIEEYSRHKKDSKDRFGRGDLWLEFEGTEYDIEAKFCRLFLNKPYKPEALIQNKMLKAVADINASPAYDEHRVRCALLACSLAINLKKPDHGSILSEEGLFEARVTHWIDCLKSAGDTVAWFVREDRNWPIFIDGKYPNFIFPGVALVLRPI